MQRIHAKSALLPSGWAKDVALTFADGCITKVEQNILPAAHDELHDIVLAGVGNLHSHAFQRAMAGLVETRGSTADSFWSWRKLMYEFALKMSPDDIEAVAALAYMEMLEAGFTRVGEFHYLHHAPDGQTYDNIAEHATRIAAASAETGIGLTLLPVFYAHAGFCGTAPRVEQRRFTNSLNQFEKLLAASELAIKDLPNTKLGVAPHSLRAVTPEELFELVALAGSKPIHIHIAEQTLEVDDCIKWSGARPVAWLLDHVPVAKNWCLIHATHMDSDETMRMAKTGAIAGLCPITEANLGDGIFNAPTFMAAGGGFGIGSDSNVQISLAAELRQLEYSQRLHNLARNVLAETNSSNGRYLYEQAVAGGAASLGVKTGLAVGNAADMISIDQSAAPYLQRDNALDHWIFADGNNVDCVWVAGRKWVQNGKHVRHDFIKTRYNGFMSKLISA